MSDLDAVIELLERWRDATGMGRLRIGVDATRVIAQLPPTRQRALAIEVAERVAPQLVPAIASESGDLTAEQVGALVDLLRRADREQLDDLVTALRTGDVGGAAGIVGDAVDVVTGPDEETDALLEDIATEDDDGATAAGGKVPPTPDDLGPPDAEHRPDGTPGDGVGAAAAGAAATAGAVATGGGAVAEGQDPAEGDAGVGAGLSAAAAAAAAAGRDHVELAEDGSLELDEEAVRQQLAEEAAQRAQQYRDSSRDIPRTPTYQAPPVDFTSDDTDFDFPDPSVESVAPIHDRLDRRTTTPTRDRRLAAPPISTAVASITATPDGYRRRRAALYAIQDGRLQADDLPAIVRSFGRDTDRSWIAGAALDAGLLEVGDLEDIGLQPAARARLRRRAR